MTDPRLLQAAEEALRRSWPVGGIIDHIEVHTALGLVIQYLKSQEEQK
jgi:hypothetical protein